MTTNRPLQKRPTTEEDKMLCVQDGTVNAVDHQPHTPWRCSDAWHYHAAIAVGCCRSLVEANPGATHDILWVRAKTVAGEVFNVHPRYGQSRIGRRAPRGDEVVVAGQIKVGGVSFCLEPASR
jgi:hypothetical protein